MEIEKKRERKTTKEKASLEDSAYRKTDFTPLIKKVEIRQPEVVEKAFEPEEFLEELTEIEKDVLTIAEDVLKLKRYDAEFDEIESESQIQKYPIIEKLYAKCISKLSFNRGYTKHDLFLAIRSLEEKSWIVTNERRTKLEVLANDKLVSILEFIRKNPGIHARDEKIEEELEITRTPFLKHIMTLERFKLIRSKKVGKSLHYFIGDVPEDLDEYRVLFLNPLIPKIIEEFFRNETVSITQLSENLEIYSGTIQYHIKKMKRLNLIKKVKRETGSIHLVNIELLKQYSEIFKEPNFGVILKGL